MSLMWDPGDLAYLASCALLQLALVVRFFQKAWPWRRRVATAFRELPKFAGVVSQWLQRPCDSDRVLRKQVSQLQLEFAQSYFSVGAATLCLSLSSLERNLLAGHPRPQFFTALATWNGLLYSFCLVATWLPGILTLRTLNLWCLISHVFVAVWLSPNGCDAPHAFAVRLFCLGVIQVPCLLFVQSWLMACVVHLGVAGIVVLRALLGDAEDAAGTIFQHPSTLFGAELIMAACVGILVRFLYNSFEQRVASRLRESHVSSQLDAASGLLQLTCEAVLELDDDLRLTEHCPKLAAMLLRGGSSTQGLRFSEFVARDEAARAEEILRGSSSVAQAFHTHLVDSCASKFRTEVFQVTYQVPSGQHRHLIGLRDFTDLQSLAGNKAADAIHDVDRELELYDGLSSLRGHSESVPEAGIHPPASSSVESNMDGSHGRRIVEQAVALQGKNMFLDIDCQAMQVCAASAPLTSLIGRGLSEVFVYNYTLELCMRLWHQAKQSQDLPDNMVSFERMPLFCLPRTIDISGIMQLSRTSLGDLHVILNFRPSAFVQL
ncbi:unnamed protein product [Effrenium voratum]|uniref:Uncharacterized protein n=1 Tax=Effrenium voratum TaxID=2562239 RepID=A0AA36NIA1_9DINO|nr:unnamed protein product [Effrenium voratum]CAJ1418098.1 unnamed protein product [Effrenium voratum]